VIGFSLQAKLLRLVFDTAALRIRLEIPSSKHQESPELPTLNGADAAPLKNPGECLPGKKTIRIMAAPWDWEPPLDWETI